MLHREISLFVPNLPTAVADVIMGLLAKDPSARSSMQRVVRNWRNFRHCLREDQRPAPPTPTSM